MEELMNILTNLRPDIDFSTADKLIDDEILDSFDIISLVGEVNEAFDVQTAWKTFCRRISTRPPP